MRREVELRPTAWTGRPGRTSGPPRGRTRRRLVVNPFELWRASASRCGSRVRPSDETASRRGASALRVPGDARAVARRVATRLESAVDAGVRRIVDGDLLGHRGRVVPAFALRTAAGAAGLQGEG